MAGKASITMDIKARVVNYQEEVAKIQAALDKIKLDTGIGKELKTEVEAFQKELSNLEKNLNPKVSTTGGIEKVESRLTHAAERLQEIGAKLQKVTLGDLDTSKLSQEIENIKKEITELEQVTAADRKGGLEQKLQAAIDHGSNLGRVLKELNIDIKEATGDKIQAGLAEGFKAAQEQIKKADEEIQNLKRSAQEYEREIEKMEASPLNQPGAQEAAYNRLTEGNLKVKDTVDITKAEDKLSEWYNLVERSTRLSDEAKERVIAFLASFEVPPSLAEANQRISDFIANAREMGTSQTALKSIFGGGSFFKDAAVVDPQTVEQVKSNIRQTLEQFKNEIGSSSNEIELLISRGAIEEARKRTIKVLDDAFKSFEGVLPEKYAKLFEMINQISNLEGQKGAAVTTQQNITRASDSVEKINQGLLEKVEAYEQRIRALEDKIAQLSSGQLDKIHQTGSGASQKAGEDIRQSTGELQKYGRELDVVNEKQKLIGKIEGLAQRWFSVYAAVNLVRRAFNDVKKTLKELDDVMTKIAIVTKMTQEDLWAQMPQYTQMARQYASSIKGVYEISQLYYQQGISNI